MTSARSRIRPLVRRWAGWAGRAIGSDPRRNVLTIALVTLAAHLVLFLAVQASGAALGPADPGFWTVTDGYVAIAASLLSQGRFALAPGAPPTAFRGPAFPAAIATVALGTRSIAWAVLLVNALAAVVNALAIYGIVRRFQPERRAAALALAASFHPLLYYYALSSFSDRFLTMAFAVYVWAALRALDERSMPRALAAGAALAFLVLTKPVFWLIPLAILPFALLWRRAWLRPLLIQTATLLVLTAPWNLRVYRLTHEVAMVALGSGFSMLVGNHAIDYGGDGGRSFDAGRVDALRHVAAARGVVIRPEELRTGVHWDIPPRLDALFRSVALQEIREHPALLARKLAINLPRFWYFSSSRGKGIVTAILNFPLLVLAIWEWLRLRRAQRDAVDWLLAMIAYTWLIYAAVLVNSRYYLPLIPLLAPFALARLVGMVVAQRAGKWRVGNRALAPALGTPAVGRAGDLSLD